ncbi:MAG: hypothetical protein AAF456_12985 [Planctomycetota bacterium]
MIQELGGDLIPVLAITCGFLIAVIWILAATIHSLVKIRGNNNLKLKLVDRGFSASEIARIVNAGDSGEDPMEDLTHATRQPTPPVKVARTAY